MSEQQELSPLEDTLQYLEQECATLSPEDLNDLKIDDFTPADKEEQERIALGRIMEFLGTYYEQNKTVSAVARNFFYLANAMVAAKFGIHRIKAIAYVEQFMEEHKVSSFSMQAEFPSVIEEVKPVFLPEEYIKSVNCSFTKFEFLGVIHLSEEGSGNIFYSHFLDEWEKLAEKAETYYQKYLKEKKYFSYEDFEKLGDWVEEAQIEEPQQFKKYAQRVFIYRYICSRLYGIDWLMGVNLGE